MAALPATAEVVDASRRVPPRRQSDAVATTAPTDATIAAGREADLADQLRLDDAVGRLARIDPDASAAYRLVPWQGVALAAGAVLLAGGLVAAPDVTLAAVLAAATLPALAFLALRVAAIRAIQATGPAPAATAAPPSEPVPINTVPIYTVMVPLYREADVAPQLVAALDALDYPADRLDVLLLVEAEDAATRRALAEALRRRPDRAAAMRVVVVPEGQPRTKPRALDYGLEFARGAFVVIYDAEDQPEPDQLRKALAGFRAAGPRLGCLQARLNVYNPGDGWLTRQFTLEYTALFDGILPALERHGLPVLLGGTSNHFPRAVLDGVGGWDPFNVTEDADLGLRLARRGYHVGVLASTTWEEAPRTYRVWLGQRTRWLKGWMQTYLVHLRRPRRLWRELGARRFLAFNLLTGGAVLSALVHPWIYVMLAWDLAAGQFLADPGAGLAPAVWWLAAANLVASYAVAIRLGALAARARGRGHLVRSSVLLPLYWLAISQAAFRAVVELARAPHHWEKTAHAGRHPTATAAKPCVRT